MTPVQEMEQIDLRITRILQQLKLPEVRRDFKKLLELGRQLNTLECRWSRVKELVAIDAINDWLDSVPQPVDP